MNNKSITELRKKVKAKLGDNKNRYWHTIGVANTCACLAMRYNVDIEKAYIAGLLHDCAKCLPDDELLYECKMNSIEVTDFEYKSPYLLHGKVGALYARTEFGIDDDWESNLDKKTAHKDEITTGDMEIVNSIESSNKAVANTTASAIAAAAESNNKNSRK